MGSYSFPSGGLGGFVPSLEVAGDSWPAGFLASTADYGYVNRLSDALHAPATNLAQSGGAATGLASEGGPAKIMQSSAIIPTLTAGPYFGRGGLKIYQCGYNDQSFVGTTDAANLAVESAMTAAMAALRGARYIGAGDGAVVGSGTGGAGDNTLVLGTGYLFADSNGDAITITTDAAYNREPITLVIPHYAAFVTTGIWTVRRDPAGANELLGTYDGLTIDNALKAPATDRNATCSFRIPRNRLPAGVNVIRMTASGLSGSNFATFGGAIIEGRNPIILPTYKARDNSLDVQIAWANTRLANVARANEGVLVDLAPVLNDAMYYGDVSHPNNLGYARVAGQIINSIAPLLSPQVTGEMN